MVQEQRLKWLSDRETGDEARDQFLVGELGAWMEALYATQRSFDFFPY